MIPIRFAIVPIRTGLSVAGLIKGLQESRRRDSLLKDSTSLKDYFNKDGEQYLPLTPLAQWEDRYVYCPLTLRMLDEKERVIDTLEIADAVATKVSRTNKIETTEVVGGKGAVIERISRGNFEVGLTFGVVAVENGEIVDSYPEEGVRELTRFFDADNTLEVYSRFLELFDIDRVVGKKYEVGQQTQSNYQQMNVELLQDVPVDVTSAIY